MYVLAHILLAHACICIIYTYFTQPIQVVVRHIFQRESNTSVNGKSLVVCKPFDDCVCVYVCHFIRHSRWGYYCCCCCCCCYRHSTRYPKCYREPCFSLNPPPPPPPLSLPTHSCMEVYFLYATLSIKYSFIHTFVAATEYTNTIAHEYIKVHIHTDIPTTNADNSDRIATATTTTIATTMTTTMSVFVRRIGGYVLRDIYGGKSVRCERGRDFIIHTQYRSSSFPPYTLRDRGNEENCDSYVSHRKYNNRIVNTKMITIWICSWMCSVYSFFFFLYFHGQFTAIKW